MGYLSGQVGFADFALDPDLGNLFQVLGHHVLVVGARMGVSAAAEFAKKLPGSPTLLMTDQFVL